ncbi:MAG: 1-deoxy-D-xylulose-5-phosphate synthase, partial [Spirulinaceae cyanobacterium RM2_2_10]|nr:1-deoxy-D-xylulose-5-phosphate synthase [Spirulinaceae cyanobacterium RM2_2_10]
MRKTFISTLVELATRDRRVLLLTGDLGYTVLEPFAQQFPDRFFNVGVAEQNMVGLAAGLADAGFLPFLYSIATFASLRPYEFLRNGAILPQLPVRVIAVGGGFEYGHAGSTHHGLEDIGVMRLQPGLAAIAPADYQQARSALLATWDWPQPVYYRLGKDDRNLVPDLDGRFAAGQVQCLGEGRDVLLVTMGSIAREVVAAAAALRAVGIDSTVAIAASLNPAPLEPLVAV